jgi:hypothetical protein
MQLLSSVGPGSTSPALPRAHVGVAVEPGRGRCHVPGEAGIWIFIFGDMTLYALLSACFMMDRRKNPGLFDQSANTLHTTFGAVNAFLLLASSLLVALGVRAARERITRYAPVLFAGAFVCASGFVINKYFEYSGLLRAVIRRPRTSSTPITTSLPVSTSRICSQACVCWSICVRCRSAPRPPSAPSKVVHRSGTWLICCGWSSFPCSTW